MPSGDYRSLMTATQAEEGLSQLMQPTVDAFTEYNESLIRPIIQRMAEELIRQTTLPSSLEMVMGGDLPRLCSCRRCVRKSLLGEENQNG